MVNAYTNRTYRRRVRSNDLVSFRVAVKQTDLWVSACIGLETETRDLVLDCRLRLETYIREHPEFAVTLVPGPDDPYAPDIVKEMLWAGKRAGVGPMAAVAGAVAQHVGSGLLRHTDQVVVENGGDIYLRVARPATVSIFAGASPLSEKVGLRIPPEQMPMGICSSSASIGHSLNTGVMDVLCVLSPSCALADAAATALGNRLQRADDLEKVPGWADRMGGLLGGVVIAGDRMAAWGDVELTAL
ncbi:MAG: UPF0280 family protein [Deltaproteobacteria bacterium]|nr:UPF0280 family protein [Deltaproteobacteria bacterium]